MWLHGLMNLELTWQRKTIQPWYVEWVDWRRAGQPNLTRETHFSVTVEDQIWSLFTWPQEAGLTTSSSWCLAYSKWLHTTQKRFTMYASTLRCSLIRILNLRFHGGGGNIPSPCKVYRKQQCYCFCSSNGIVFDFFLCRGFYYLYYLSHGSLARLRLETTFFQKC